MRFIVLKKLHLFGLGADRSQHERVEDVFSSQEETVTVLVQEDGGERQLVAMPAEDGRPVGGQQVCRDRWGEKDEQCHRFHFHSHRKEIPLEHQSVKCKQEKINFCIKRRNEVGWWCGGTSSLLSKAGIADLFWVYFHVEAVLITTNTFFQPLMLFDSDFLPVLQYLSHVASQSFAARLSRSCCCGKHIKPVR